MVPLLEDSCWNESISARAEKEEELKQEIFVLTDQLSAATAALQDLESKTEVEKQVYCYIKHTKIYS